MREKKNLQSRQFISFMNIYIFTKICILAKMNTLKDLNIIVQILCANTVDKNQEAMA